MVLQLTIMHRTYCKLNCLLYGSNLQALSCSQGFVLLTFRVLKTHQNNINGMLPMPFHILKDIYTSLNNRGKWPRLFVSDGSLLFYNTHWKTNVNSGLTIMYLKLHKNIVVCTDQCFNWFEIWSSICLGCINKVCFTNTFVFMMTKGRL